MSALTDRLIAHGAPVLKGILENVVGGVGGRLAGAVVDELASSLGVAPTEEAVAEAIERDPDGASAVIERVETDMARIAEAGRDALVSYHGVLLEDAKAEGWLASRWRPIFAMVYSLCFLMLSTTLCRALWTAEVNALTAFATLTGFLIFFYSTGAAVLGVYVWKRSDEKVAGQ
jgi:hypothetical protein